MYRDNRNVFLHLNWGAPVELRWNGWRSDSYQLESKGWSFFADEAEDVQTDSWRIHLAATSPDGGVTISGSMYIRRGDFINRYDRCDTERLLHRGFDMQQYTIKDIFRTNSISMLDIKSWQRMTPVDMREQTVVSMEQIYYMRDFKVFKPTIIKPEKEIYIPEENVDDLLNKILKIQYKDSKKKLLLPETRPIIQAQIFSL